MPSLLDALQALYPNASNVTDYTVALGVDGHPHIVSWNLALGPRPSEIDLATVTDAQVATAKQRAKNAAATVAIQALSDHPDPAVRALFQLLKALIVVLNQTRQKTGDAPITVAAIVKTVTDALAS